MTIEFWWILGVFTISESVPRPLRPGIHLHQSRSSIATSHSAIRFFAALLTRITRIMKSAGHMLINFVQNYNLAGKNDDQSWDLGAPYMFKQTQNCFDHHSEPAKPLRKEKNLPAMWFGLQNSRLHGNLSVLAAKAAIAATADAVRTLFVAQEYSKHSRQPGRPNKSLQSVDKFKSCTF